MPGWAREGISLLLLRPAFPVPRLVFAAQPLPEATASQGLWAAVLSHQARGASTGEVPGRRMPWWVLLPENPGSICTLSRSRPLFSRVTDWLICQGLPSPSFIKGQDKQLQRKLPPNLLQSQENKRTDGELVGDAHSGCGWQGGPQFCKSSI